jgi:hypothetical protein
LAMAPRRSRFDAVAEGRAMRKAAGSRQAETLEPSLSLTDTRAASQHK